MSMTSAAPSKPSVPAPPKAGGHDHGRRARGRSYDPAFSVLRASFAQRAIIAAGLAAVLWVAVIWVTP
ncbi:hypothetical protein [Aquabacter sp. CN5-332]|uniref:hypothetical protein n=1 Tax=Aquabacter sp. CN5-332 TaxID=3156608 RepID=UPI0032B61FB1